MFMRVFLACLRRAQEFDPSLILVQLMIGVTSVIHWTREHQRQILLIAVAVLVTIIADNYYQLHLVKSTALSEKNLLQDTNSALQIEKSTLQGENSVLKIEKSTLQKQNSALKDQVQQAKDNINAFRVENKSLQEQLKSEKEKLKYYYEVWSIQVKYIRVWLGGAGQLEDFIEAVIHYSELKKRDSFSDYDRSRMEHWNERIGFDLDINRVGLVTLKAVELIKKFRDESDKFFSTLTSMDVKDMEDQQANTKMNKIKVQMKKFIEEVSSDFQAETGVQRRGIFSKIGSVVIDFRDWLYEKIETLFTT